WQPLRQLRVSSLVARRCLLVVGCAGVARVAFAPLRDPSACRVRVHVLQRRGCLCVGRWPLGGHRRDGRGRAGLAGKPPTDRARVTSAALKSPARGRGLYYGWIVL